MQKIENQLHPSRQFILLHSTILICSIAIIISLPFMASLKLAFIAATLIYSAFIQYGQHQWQAIRVSPDGWALQRSNQYLPIEIVGDSTITTRVSVLRFVITGERCRSSCLIFKDSMDGDAYRQLIVRLRNMS
ncbi:MAG: protein YgfX [Gammaproteobacteria bacterium]